jgi:hypothetical protein
MSPRVSRAQCSMSSASTIYSVCAHRDCAAHDALQTRDRTKLRPEPGAVPDQRRTAARIRTSVDRASAGVGACAAPHPGHGSPNT